MAIKISKTDEAITAYLLGDIDHHSAKQIREQIDMEIEKSIPKLLVIDFDKVSFMDSSGIGLVMGRYKLMSNMGGKLKITNLSTHINKVMKLAGINSLSIISEN